jgi:hypothetical protein
MRINLYYKYNKGYRFFGKRVQVLHFSINPFALIRCKLKLLQDDFLKANRRWQHLQKRQRIPIIK